MRHSLTDSTLPSRRQRLALPITIAFAAAFVAGCSSSNNTKPSATSTPPPAASASAAATQPPNGSAVAKPPTAHATLPPIGTPSADLIATAKKLQPLLFQTADLPEGERAFQPGAPVPVGNDDLVRGRPDAAPAQAQFEQAGRLGGVYNAWAMPGGQITKDTKSLFQVSCLISAYRDATGAKQGYDLTIAQIQNAPAASAATKSTVSDLTPVDAGSANAAYRQDQAITSSGGTPPQLFTTHEVADIEVWQRGAAVATCQLSALGEDPPLGDFQQIVRAQDGRLQGGGY